jgi:AraC-like DNA-binding protein
LQFPSWISDAIISTEKHHSLIRRPTVKDSDNSDGKVFKVDITSAPGRDTVGKVDDARGVNLRDLASHIAVGERTLRRRSQEHFGYGPKTLERIVRFQRFLRGTRNPRRDSLADLALNAGYADQAHMNREVKALSTLTISSSQG